MTLDGRATASLSTQSLTICGGARQLVAELSIEFAPRQFVAILGRNGCGKTLTVHTLAGLRRPERGTVYLAGIPVPAQGRRAIARQVGLLLQDQEESFTTTALEAVLIGRHPHLAPWRWEGAEDERVARAALARVELGDCALRHTGTLSGGESRRVAIATLLAQEPQIFLLDEPTNHLDPQHQLAVLGLFRELADAGRTVIATLHDPTLAARFADRAILLFGDGRWAQGATRDVLTGASLTELYRTPMVEIVAPGRRVFVNA